MIYTKIARKAISIFKNIRISFVLCRGFFLYNPTSSAA